MRRKSNWAFINIITDHNELHAKYELNDNGGLKKKLKKKRPHSSRFDQYYKFLGSRVCFQGNSTNLNRTLNSAEVCTGPPHIPFPPNQCDGIGTTNINNSTSPSNQKDPPKEISDHSLECPLEGECHEENRCIFRNFSSSENNSSNEDMFFDQFWQDRM